MLRTRSKAIGAVLVLVLVAACDSSTKPTPIVVYVTPAPTSPAVAAPSSGPASAPAVASPAASASGAPPSSAPSASPPVADAATAGKAYLAAAGRYNKAIKALDRKYKTFGTLARVHAYYRTAAKLDRAFSDAIRKIAFPPEMVGDVKSLLQKNAALESSEIALAHATAGSYYGDQKAYERASRSASAAANLVRQDLGLPSVPF